MADKDVIWRARRGGFSPRETPAMTRAGGSSAEGTLTVGVPDLILIALPKAVDTNHLRRASSNHKPRGEHATHEAQQLRRREIETGPLRT